MRKAIRRLRLRPGDIILVRDHHTMEALITAARGMKDLPNCPIVIAREGVHRMSKEYLKKLVAS